MRCSRRRWGRCCTLFTTGAAVIEGSSVLGLSQTEYEALTPEERRDVCRRAEETFRAAGAHFVLNDLSQLPELIRMIG